MSLWWIPRDRIRALSASDLAVLRMCRLLTVFLLAATLYLGSVLIGAARASVERDHLRRQIQHCGCVEAPP